ncbi:unnamed protein product [Didymodactylos carnosus]|nr:unnamed protein product [Didymodactylos carnosus]CAF4262661.1 unnamed protein product [Didymodactylos carnosus]
MQDFQTALQRLREEIDNLKQLVQELIDNAKLSVQDIEKADKRDLDNRVLKKDFHVACGELAQSVNDCLQKFNTHDDVQKQDLEKITRDVDSKLDRGELNALRDYIEKQLKKLKKMAKDQQTQQQHVHMMSEDEAAGLRKQLIRFHCISCDRPIDVAPRETQPSLPAERGIRPIQSPRPYTTFELDQIRQFQKSQQFNSDYGYDVYASVRQCGGSHTTTLPFKRQAKTQPTVPEETPLTKSEVDIQGHDGHIYKGRIDAKLSVDISKKQGMIMLTRPRSATQITRAQLSDVDAAGIGTDTAYPTDIGGGNSLALPNAGIEHGSLLVRQQQEPRQEPTTTDMRFN